MLTCVTWNTQGSNGVEASVERLIADGADVVFLQEAAESGDVAGYTYDFQGRTGTRSRPGVLYEGARTRWHGGYQGATSVILRTGLGPTAPMIIPHPDGVSRGLLYTTINRGGNTLYLGTVHAWSPSGNDWDLIANNLMGQIMAIAGANRVIIGGDFNQAAGRSAIGSWARPGPTHFGGGGLDAFWYCNLAPGEFHAQGILGSAKGDHFPTWAQFNL